MNYKIKEINNNDTCIIFPELFEDNDNGDFVISFEHFDKERAKAFRDLYIKNFNISPAFGDDIYKSTIKNLIDNKTEHSLINIIDKLQPKYPDGYKFIILPYKNDYVEIAETYGYPDSLDNFYAVEDNLEHLPSNKILGFLCICTKN